MRPEIPQLSDFADSIFTLTDCVIEFNNRTGKPNK